MNYSNSKRTNSGGSVQWDIYATNNDCVDKVNMRTGGGYDFFFLLLFHRIINCVFCERENSPLYPQGPIQMPPCRGIFPDFSN